MNSDNNRALSTNDTIVRNWLIGIGIALIIIVAITFAIHRKDTISPVIGSDMSTTTATTTAMEESMTASPSMTATVPATGEMIAVNNQRPGGTVAIASMTLSKKSWVAIKDSKGVILGAGLFQANETSGVVPLLRGTQPGQTYEAVIYVDTTDKVFDWHQDQLVVSAGGAPVSAMFTVR